VKNSIFTVVPFSATAMNETDIVSSKEAIPEWYKRSPQKIEGSTTELQINNPSATTSTYKRCSPFLDALTSGYMVLLNVDVEVSDSPDGFKYLRWRPDQSVVSGHTNNEWQGLVPPQGYVNMLYKWSQDFGITTPKGYSCLFTHPSNRFDLPFITLNAVVDTDNFNMPIHFPFFLREDFVGIIEKGTPICQVLPFKRDSWAKVEEKYEENKVLKLNSKFSSKIIRSYKTQYWSRKEYN
jgi:hypothetical protein